MAKVKTWIKASRPRTVLLSISGVLLGGFLAANLVSKGGFFYPAPILFAAITAVLLQILSNLANDYGDFKKGTDNAKRVGPQREMQSGAITEKEMKWALVIVSGLCLLSGFLLLFVYYVAQVAVVPHYRFLFVLSFFIALGIGAVLAALLYTLGKRPYGYRGLGDLFCFRDYENDKASGKNSLVVKLGLKKAFIYHCLLIGGTFVCLTVYLVLHHAPWYSYLFLLLLILFIKDLVAIKKTKPEQLDPFLGRQVKHSFLLVTVYGLLLLV